MLNQDKKFTRLYLYIFGFVTFIIGITIAFLINIDVPWNSAWVEIVKATASLAILASIVLAIKNYKYIKKWNQQKAAIDALHNSKKLLKKYTQLLDQELSIQEKIMHNKIFTIEELHNFIGVFMENGDFIFHGEENQKNIKCIHNGNNGYTKEFIHNKGREIYEAIEEVLNEYEYLCMAANQGVFYRKTIIELRGTGILRIFNLFSNHIYHLRYDNRHGYGPRLYEHLEKFSKEISENLNLDINKPNKEGYSSIFDKKD